MPDKKPTPAKLYREFMRGRSMQSVWMDNWDHFKYLHTVENAIRKYLIRREKRRKRCPKK